jgi:MFS transporter, ACS family, tartrate transporter
MTQMYTSPMARAAAAPAAEAAAGTSALRKVGSRLIPVLWLMYVAAFLDRASVGFAALQMNRELGFSASVYGLGAGIFFIGYCLFEVPSNLLLHRVGAPRWLARIMLSWAVVAGAMALVRGPASFYTLRFLLGIAEAGFFPGAIYYLSYWLPAAERARLVSVFMTAIPIATAIAGPLSTAILSLDGIAGIAGWQWLYVLETLPSLALGLVAITYLPKTPATAQWLTPAEKSGLLALRQTEQAQASGAHNREPSVLRALASPTVLGLSLCYFGVELGLYGVIFWIPQIFSQVGIKAAHLGWAVAIPYALAALGMVWWSRHSDRQAERSLHLLAASVAGFLGLAISARFADSPLISLLAITLGATGTLAVLPIFWTRPATLLGGAAAAGVIALINAVGHIGGFVGPYVMGALKETTGRFTGGLLVSACGVLLTGILTILMSRRPTPGLTGSRNEF